MKLIKLLWNLAARLLILCFIGSVIEGALKLYLVATITRKIVAPDSVALAWPVFLLLAVVAAIAHLTNQSGITYTARLAVNDLRTKLVESIIATRLAEIEKAGSTRVLAVLTEDGARLVAALPGTVALLRDVTFSAICLAYLAWISPATFAFVCIGLVLVACLYHPLQLSGIKHMRKIIVVSEALFDVFRNLLDGIKQVKLNKVLQGGITKAIAAKQEALQSHTLKSFLGLGASSAMAMLLLFVLLSTVAYGRFSGFLDTQAVTTYAVLLIMLMGPLGTITSTLHSLSQAGTALDRLFALRSTFDSGAESAASTAVPRSVSDGWQPLELRDVTYAYDAARSDGFSVGPLSLQLRSGQVLFIVGGNGSGKTTVAKLIVGFYTPQSGAVRLDGRLIDASSRSWYREHFATVFNDYSLFESLADSASDITRRIDSALLKQFRIDHLLPTADELFACARTFSTGERKRTALLLACLDDRPIYLFDEFAADQDPECRELFYRQIVPTLRDQGKLVIVVSHDTRYFDCADVILTLERGVVPVVTHNRRASAVASAAAIS